jgi:hypothetical protein
MLCVTAKKIKRGYLIDEDIVDLFDKWTDRTGMEKQVAVQAAMWHFMALDPIARQQAMDEMRDRAGLSSEDEAAARAEAERVIAETLQKHEQAEQRRRRGRQVG